MTLWFLNVNTETFLYWVIFNNHYINLLKACHKTEVITFGAMTSFCFIIKWAAEKVSTQYSLTHLNQYSIPVPSEKVKKPLVIEMELIFEID